MLICHFYKGPSSVVNECSKKQDSAFTAGEGEVAKYWKFLEKHIFSEHPVYDYDYDVMILYTLHIWMVF